MTNSSVAMVLGIGVAVFVSTNIDDIFLLSAFFTDPRLTTRSIVIGQQILAVMGDTIANGGDNLSVYTPLFAKDVGLIPAHSCLWAWACISCRTRSSFFSNRLKNGASPWTTGLARHASASRRPDSPSRLTSIGTPG